MLSMAQPSHPGVFIRMEIIEPLGISVTDAAHLLNVSRPALSTLLNGRTALSPEMAQRMEMAFGVTMDTLLRMQTAHDIAAQRARGVNLGVRRYEPKVA